jgi:hypothetical protein
MTDLLILNCNCCSYKTNRFFNLKRHVNAKHFDKISENTAREILPIIHKKFEENVTTNLQNVTSFLQNVTSQKENVTSFLQNVTPYEEQLQQNNKNVSIDIAKNEHFFIEYKKKLFECAKCKKQYNTQKYLQNHEKNCKFITPTERKNETKLTYFYTF